uniref:Uncharacterized protein n=1 Tax=Triticum urartu TaxID=4572 RepID=A0A8R7JUW0_TRIUA
MRIFNINIPEEEWDTTHICIDLAEPYLFRREPQVPSTTTVSNCTTTRPRPWWFCPA